MEVRLYFTLRHIPSVVLALPLSASLHRRCCGRRRCHHRRHHHCQCDRTQIAYSVYQYKPLTGSLKSFKLNISVFPSGEDPGDNLKIKYAVQTKTGDTTLKLFKCPRNILFNAWHKVVVRFQDEENLIRIYVDDNLVGAETFKGGIAAFPADAQLRLAQSYEIFQEAQPSIEKRFRVGVVYTGVSGPLATSYYSRC